MEVRRPKLEVRSPKTKVNSRLLCGFAASRELNPTPLSCPIYIATSMGKCVIIPIYIYPLCGLAALRELNPAPLRLPFYVATSMGKCVIIPICIYPLCAFAALRELNPASLRLNVLNSKMNKGPFFPIVNCHTKRSMLFRD